VTASTSAIRSVLMVEDDDRLRKTLCDYAQNRGCTTWQAANGLEALWIVKHHRPELVLLDLFLPRLDGFETVRHIRKFDPAIRIVAVTGDRSDDTRRRVERLGLELVVKPLTLEILDALFVGRPS